MGLDRKTVEPFFQSFDDSIRTNRLSRAQAHRLAWEVPGVRDAAIEIQLAYALKHYDLSTTRKEIHERQADIEVLSCRSC